MNDPKKWWLISDEDVQLIKKGLTVPNFKVRARALHALDSGLHKTDAIPDDWKKDGASDTIICPKCKKTLYCESCYKAKLEKMADDALLRPSNQTTRKENE